MRLHLEPGAATCEHNPPASCAVLTSYKIEATGRWFHAGEAQQLNNEIIGQQVLPGVFKFEIERQFAAQVWPQGEGDGAHGDATPEKGRA
jgi:hypothetical protein